MRTEAAPKVEEGCRVFSSKQSRLPPKRLGLGSGITPKYGGEGFEPAAASIPVRSSPLYPLVGFTCASSGVPWRLIDHGQPTISSDQQGAGGPAPIRHPVTNRQMPGTRVQRCSGRAANHCGDAVAPYQGTGQCRSG